MPTNKNNLQNKFLRVVSMPTSELPDIALASREVGGVITRGDAELQQTFRLDKK